MLSILEKANLDNLWVH